MIVIVGGGPAGIAAARAARECGADVTLIDDNPGLGGQIWRGAQIGGDTGRVLSSARVVALENGAVLFETTSGAERIWYSKLILATGSRELFLPFPGWTLPGVVGAGGLQALTKAGLALAGKRVVIAGTGPLLIAVAAYLRQRGADVRLVAEQASPQSLLQFGRTLLHHPAKLLQGARLAGRLAGVSYLTNCWVEAAEPGRLHLRQGNRRWTEAFDYAGIGYGLIPNDELRSPDAIVAPTGDVELATLEGSAAGYLASGRDDLAHALRSRLDKARAFDAALQRAFALRPELKALPRPETFVCRCEDVTHGRARGYPTFRAAKLHTRCGMGPCQGRVCGAAGRFLYGWTDTSVRPPVFPARIGTLVTKEGNQ